MTYHEFLRAVWRSASKGPVTFESFDAALIGGLRRMYPDLHDEAMAACAVRVPGHDDLKFTTPAVLAFLERNWPAPKSTGRKQ